MVQQGDAWYCEHDGKTYESRERRYIMRVKAADASGECFLHLFNDQVRLHCRVQTYVSGFTSVLTPTRPKPSASRSPSSRRPQQQGFRVDSSTSSSSSSGDAA